MKTKVNFKVLLVVLMMVIITMSGCAKSMTSVSTLAPSEAQATPTLHLDIVEAIATPLPTAIEPTAEATIEPTATFAPTDLPSTWTQIQVGNYSDGIQIDGLVWELVKGTWFAVSTLNGQYEAVPSTSTGSIDSDWCGPTQYDCPPHAILVLVEVPEDKVSCLKAEMDISWRINFTNTCGLPVPVRMSIRYNDVTRSPSELMEDYLALAGLKQQVLDATSEVGLFVSVRENGMSTLTYQDKKINFGYSCWDCLPDTKGPNDPNPYPLVDIETFGVQGSGPTGSSLLPGVVFALPRPAVDPYMLTFEMKVVDQAVVWIGEYDVPLPVAPTPTPTVTP